jgi:glycosyltransferase involved in cell wall biosynthesis
MSTTARSDDRVLEDSVSLPAISVVISTYNRADLLADAIDHVLGQEDPDTPPFELLVVDNNSTDTTRTVVAAAETRDRRVRYIFESNQGLSHARNAGIAAARGPIVTFTDDDVRVGPGWLAAIARTFIDYPEASAVGGKVLPLWPAPPPSWLTTARWGPLALVDHGDSPVRVDSDNPLCLVGANLAVSRRAFDLVGAFSTVVQRVTDTVGSMEDDEFLQRLFRAGCFGVYDPRIVIHAAVQPERLDRAYHRQWHTGHGHFHALMRPHYLERSKAGRLLDVPAHLYRAAAIDGFRWVRAKLRGDDAEAFARELALRFFAGFLRTRRRQSRDVPLSVRSVQPRQGSVGRRPRRRLAVGALREVDRLLSRYDHPDVRDVLFDARTSMEYAMMAPVHEVLAGDPRVRVWLTSSERPRQVEAIYRQARAAARISPRWAMTRRFDACLAADFVWASLPRGSCRVQMFHGVAGKWGHIYDRPTMSMRDWHRLFFINERRLRNFVAAGAIDVGSDAIRLVGMPKADCLVNGSLQRDAILAAAGLDPERPSVLYAPTWTQFSSLNAMGEEVVRGLMNAGYTVLVKLHDNSLDMAYESSGGIDWVARLSPLLQGGHGLLVRDANASPWLVAADVLVSDHSSIGFEYLLLDRPVVRIEMPELIRRAGIPEEYVALMAAASTTVSTAGEALAGVERAFASPGHKSDSRRHVAAELFYGPGGATQRAIRELYALIELAEPAVPRAFDENSDTEFAFAQPGGA